MTTSYMGKSSAVSTSYPSVPSYHPNQAPTTGMMGIIMPSATPAVVFAQPQSRRCVFDQNVKTLNLTLIMNDVVNSLRGRNVQIEEVECTGLAASLSALDARMTKIVLEMIIEFKQANQGEIQVMGKKDAIPFSGKYDTQNKSTSFDLFKMPDTLILILAEFIKLMQVHRK